MLDCAHSKILKKVENQIFIIFEHERNFNCPRETYTIMLKNFGDIPPRPKFSEESDGATRFLIGLRSFGVKNGLFRGIS